MLVARPVTLPELAAVADARWEIEDCFAEARPTSTTTRSTGTGPGTGTPPSPWSAAPSSPAPHAPACRPRPAGTRGPAGEAGPDICGQRFRQPRTYGPIRVREGLNGRDHITDNLRQALDAVNRDNSHAHWDVPTRVSRHSG